MGTLYMGGDSSTIAPTVIFSGDPWRVEVVKDYLDRPKKVAFNREFNTYTGSYKDVPVTVTSTGMGAPTAAVAVEEMYASGMRVAIRMGTVMSLDDDMLGEFFVPVAAMRREATSDTYVDKSFPAVADFDLINVMNEVVHDYGHRSSNGISCSMDGFYTQMHDSKFSREFGRDISKIFHELHDLHVGGVDMETSCMLTVCRLMGVKACSLTVATVLENLKAALQGKARTDAEDLLCRVALEGAYRYNKRFGA